MRQISEPFHVLALSGGGARGIFQARLLELAAANSNTPLPSSFDLIAATSTGALVGLALALDIAPSRIVQLYRLQSGLIFHRRLGSWLRRGGRYDKALLEHTVREIFGSARMRDLRTSVMIATSVVDTYQGRFYTERDADTLVADVALATAAAPTYFPPHVMAGEDRGQMDGGFWANDPSYLAVHHALVRLGVPAACIYLLSIGTGRVEHGESPRAIQRMRTLDARTPRFVFDFLTNLQAWSAETLIEMTLPPAQITRINPHLRKWIALDDAASANDVLPGVAQGEYDRHNVSIQAFLGRTHAGLAPDDSALDLPIVLRRGLHEARITKFIPSRKYYAQFREGRESIGSYIALASTSLTMVSINLATGLELEKVIDTFDEMINRREHPVRMTISLLDPERPFLMEALAPVLDLSTSELQERVARALSRLVEFRQRLPRQLRSYFTLKAHQALPNASAILIDADLSTGVIQLETKAYQASMHNSFGFEVASGSEFYRTLHISYQKLIADGRTIAAEGD